MESTENLTKYNINNKILLCRDNIEKTTDKDIKLTFKVLKSIRFPIIRSLIDLCNHLHVVLYRDNIYEIKTLLVAIHDALAICTYNLSKKHYRYSIHAVSADMFGRVTEYDEKITAHAIINKMYNAAVEMLKSAATDADKKMELISELWNQYTILILTTKYTTYAEIMASSYGIYCHFGGFKNNLSIASIELDPTHYLNNDFKNNKFTFLN